MDSDGTLMSPQVALARYPEMAPLIESHAVAWATRTRVERREASPLHQTARAFGTAVQLVRALSLAVIAGCVLYLLWSLILR